MLIFGNAIIVNLKHFSEILWYGIPEVEGRILQDQHRGYISQVAIMVEAITSRATELVIAEYLA